MRTGPIILIEDDEDDQYLFQQLIDELKLTNPLRFFTNGQQALDYLMTTSEQPFIILCDMNMPIMSGMELRRQIDAHETLKKRAVPFIFLTTSASEDAVEAAYESTIQGYFKKANEYEAAKEQLQWIVGYWRHCVHPNNQPWS